jgi:hypothetical protein
MRQVMLTMLENLLKWLLNCAHKVLVVVVAFLVALLQKEKLEPLRDLVNCYMKV